MPILRDRPSCPICGAAHSEFNRVNWWSSNGIPYGPKTKPDNTTLMCDECARKRFAWREEFICHLSIEEQVGLGANIRELLKDEDVNFDKFEKALDTSVVLVAKIRNVTAGFISFSFTRESDSRAKYFVIVNGLFVNPYYRNLGIGFELFNRMIRWASVITVNYYTFDECIAPNVFKFAVKIGAVSLTNIKNSFVIGEMADE